MTTREFIRLIQEEQCETLDTFDILEKITKGYERDRSLMLLKDLKVAREKDLVKLAEETNKKIKESYLIKSHSKCEVPSYIIPTYDEDTNEFNYKEIEIAVNYSNPLLNELIDTLEKKLNSHLEENISDNAVTSTRDYVIPPELNSDKARKFFKRAVENGLMTENFVWLHSKEMLAYFVRTMSDELKIGKGVSMYTSRPRICWKPFEKLMKLKTGKVKAGKLREWNAGYERDERLPPNHNIIDLIFKD